MNISINALAKKCLHSLCKHLLISLAVLLGVFMIGHQTDPVLAAESQSRTESNCTIGMAKGDKNAECQVPILSGCTVAQFPGYQEPWVDISKGGSTSCQFDEKKTDWKTRIVGTCDTCKTEQCTGRFIVMFNCSGNVPAASTGSPPPH
ncbi:MAG: hypothetical protein AB7T38_09225 [Nitrospirales bacterium]